MAATRTPNVFNDMAEMIFQLKCLNRDAFYDKVKRDACYPLDVREKAERFISSRPELENGKKLLSNGISPETMRALRAWLTGKPEQVRFYYLLEVLLGLERRIGTTDLLESSFYTQLTNGGTEEFTSLNSNVGDTGIFILPKVQSIYSPPSSGEPEQKNALNFVGARRPGIGEELRNIYYYESGDLQIGECRYRARHSVLNVPGSNDEENQSQIKQKVTIAVSPLTNRPLALHDECEFYDLGSSDAPDRRFSVQFRDSNNQLARRILKDIEAAGNEGADIVIFPEMYGCEETVTATDALEDPLPEANVLARAAESLGEKLSRLILLPTWWHNYSNKLYVRSSPERIQCVQQKQFPFPCQSEKDGPWYREDLRGQDHVIHMVHIPGLGRFAFPICRDIIEETDYVNLMRKTLWATFLLCPSYSPGKTQFLQRGSTQEFGCYTVWCNACGAAYSDGRPANYVGFVASPLLSGERITYFQPQCNGTCGPDGVCLFLIDLDRDGTVQRCEHIHR